MGIFRGDTHSPPHQGIEAALMLKLKCERGLGPEIAYWLAGLPAIFWAARRWQIFGFQGCKWAKNELKRVVGQIWMGRKTVV